MHRLLDGEVSVAALTDNSGNILSTAQSAPYGAPLSGSGSDALLYAGLEQDPEGYHTGYRGLDNYVERWLKCRNKSSRVRRCVGQRDRPPSSSTGIQPKLSMPASLRPVLLRECCVSQGAMK